MRLSIPTIVVVLALVACGNQPLGPETLYPSYYLFSIDRNLLPATALDLPGGTVVVRADLQFPRNERPREGDAALARYSRTLRFADQTEQVSSIELNYFVTDRILHVDLCPPLAACLVPTELVGPVHRDSLLLTHSVGGAASSIYRYLPVLPE